MVPFYQQKLVPLRATRQHSRGITPIVRQGHHPQVYKIARKRDRTRFPKWPLDRFRKRPLRFYRPGARLKGGGARRGQHPTRNRNAMLLTDPVSYAGWLCGSIIPPHEGRVKPPFLTRASGSYPRYATRRYQRSRYRSHRPTATFPP